VPLAVDPVEAGALGVVGAGSGCVGGTVRVTGAAVRVIVGVVTTTDGTTVRVTVTAGGTGVFLFAVRLPSNSVVPEPL
jgi:hypothetical protein